MARHDPATKCRTGIEREVLADPTWWAALPLAERRRTPVRESAVARMRGADRLAAWQTDRAVTGGIAPDLSRWQDSGLGAEELALLLGETPANIRERLPEPPRWLTSLARAWAVDPSDLPASDDGLVEHVGPS